MSKKTMFVNGKVSDCCFVSFPNGKQHDGYVPQNIGLGEDSDYIELEIDIETGKIQGWNSKIKNNIIKLMNKK